MRTAELFDLTKSAAAELLQEYEYAEDALPKLSAFIESLFDTLDFAEYDEISDGVWVSKSARVAKNATVMPPCIIGAETEIRQCAFIRGSVLIGKGCVVGNSSEVKNSILFDRVQIPHFNYVGDSILGYSAHLGAGAVTSNVKSDKSDVCVTHDGVRRSVGRYKLGALIGDFAEIGCGAVLCPGTIIGRNTTVYPLSLVRGTVPGDSIYKSAENIIKKC